MQTGRRIHRAPRSCLAKPVLLAADSVETGARNRAVLRRRAQTPSGQWGAIEEHDRAMRAIAPEERPNLDKANDDTRP